MDEKTGKFVAVKILHNRFTELEVSLLQNEVRALMRLAGKGELYVAKILDFNFQGEIRDLTNNITRTCYFIMPIEEHGEFYNIIDKTQGFAEPIARVLFENLLSGTFGLRQP
jgi:hypothetical protein